MKFATATNEAFAPGARRDPAGSSRSGKASGFTLAEVLAAMLLMAIVIPVAVEAMHIASVSGVIAVRKAEAARIADALLNENLVTTNWNRFANGVVRENGLEFRWTLQNEPWSADSGLQLVTAEVGFAAQGRTYSVHLSTLANRLVIGSATSTSGTGMP